MEKKKVVYQLTRKKYQLVEVDTEEQENLIKELNRNFERECKRDKVSQSRYLSLTELSENGREIIEESPNAEECFLEKEEREQTKLLIHNALNQLTPRQRKIVIMAFFEEKSQVEIARELGVTAGAISITLERAKSNLKKFLDKNKNFF